MIPPQGSGRPVVSSQTRRSSVVTPGFRTGPFPACRGQRCGAHDELTSLHSVTSSGGWHLIHAGRFPCPSSGYRTIISCTQSGPLLQRSHAVGRHGGMKLGGSGLGRNMPPLHKSAWERSRVAPGALRGSHGKAMCPHLPPASLDHRSARIDSKAKHAIIFQDGTETSSKKLSVSLFAATQVATHPGISSSDDQDMMGRVRYGSPNAC